MPTSPTEVLEKERERKTSVVSPGLGEEDEIEAEFLGEGDKGMTEEIRAVSLPLFSS